MIKKYIDIAFAGDDEIDMYFDPAYPGVDPKQAGDLVYQKLLANYSEASFEKIDFEGEPVGYFVWSPGLLISFGMNIKYRSEGPLSLLWGEIRERLGEEFSIALFSNNTRGIKWLQRCGMQIFAEQLTILVHTKK